MKLVKLSCLDCGETIEVPEDLAIFQRTDFEDETTWSWSDETGHCHYSRVKKAKKQGGKG